MQEHAGLYAAQLSSDRHPVGTLQRALRTKGGAQTRKFEALSAKSS